VATHRGLMEVGWHCRGESRPWRVVVVQEDRDGTSGGGVLCSGASSMVVKSSGEATLFPPYAPPLFPPSWLGVGKARPQVAAVGGERPRASGAPFYSRAAAMASDGRWDGAVGDVEGKDVPRLGFSAACRGVAMVTSAISNLGDQKVAGVASPAAGPRRRHQRGTTSAGGVGQSALDHGHGARPSVHSRELMIVRQGALGLRFGSPRRALRCSAFLKTEEGIAVGEKAGGE
jgi:hypothetical protein